MDSVAAAIGHDAWQRCKQNSAAESNTRPCDSGTVAMMSLDSRAEHSDAPEPTQAPVQNARPKFVRHVLYSASRGTPYQSDIIPL